MYQDERLEEILKIVSKKKVISNEDLLNQVYSSKSTLRRDLIILEKQGKIERKFGYITVVDASNVEFGYQIRMKKRRV
ncbi:DeoR/GlpR transcriptional regulator [Lactobacillus salivarius]|uniref:DeoR family transcriptional regulator n=1 Tax=Ligilactobacillus salivarius TaxID=1624 RepID=UPI0015C6665C|nr:DeoR family transcriptional regulator [Ligilactobacillus salivarius]NXZ97097.1 DeoR/GlpR transcriptional regulator [Ligilactobacillus salivarius]NYA59890.1 DeoR/GlpR transcriptional regulator [Ligilactobacillus salivarius]NYA68961.1 DeoR/GlpR transcriptional regulator [Ligilactobacillus salivarius]NYA74651.1 DeoR/GlpR transcriptional regulator [Ligilactobacillus salivarius]